MFTISNEAIIWQHIRRSRIELVGYLETLSEGEWNYMSLCDGWRTRDVIAHLILIYHYSASGSWKDFARSGFSINRFMEKTAIELGNKPTDELVRQFRSMADEQRKPKSVPAMNVLVDLLIHEQDIRVPLGQPKDMDLDSLRLVFSHWKPEEYNLGEKITGVAGRVKGLKFTITDLCLSKGSGSEVVGSAQDVLLAVVGRLVSVDRLSGEGAGVLGNRLK